MIFILIHKIKYKNANLISDCNCPFDFENFYKHSIALLICLIYKKDQFFDIDFFLDRFKWKKQTRITRINPKFDTIKSIVNNV